jgi:ribosomal protein S18 acetylase RimI-like enzyme
MRSAGEASITLNVNVNNPPAAALYRRLGFTRIGRRARYQARARVPQPPRRSAAHGVEEP